MTAGTNRDYKRGVLDRLPYGVDEGAAKLMLAYQGYYLATNKQTDKSLIACAIRISDLAQKIESYEERTQNLRSKFGRYATKGASFLAENSAIFGAAAIGAFAGGPTGSIAGTTTTTFPQAFGSAFINELDKAGYDAKVPEQIIEAFQDKEFMKHAKRASYIHAGQMSSAVFLAGTLAGYLYSAFAKPVASVGTSVARTIMPRIVGESAGLVGELFAQGARSAVNAAGKKAVQRIPVRALFLTAAMSGASAQAAPQQPQTQQQEQRDETVKPVPHYNHTRMYL